MLYVKNRGRYQPAPIAYVCEQAARYLLAPLEKRDAMANPRAVREYFTTRLATLEREEFCVMFLDNRHRVIACDCMFQGTIDGASVHPREVVKAALAHNAAAVILAHNHPSGVAEPSHSDELITQRLKDALALMDIRTLDHIIIGKGCAVSFAERGLI
jgi:DNA repair protein RadC